MAVTLAWPGLYRPNPAVYLKPEKGKPHKLSTKWVDYDSGDDLSNSHWLEGDVNFQGQLPRVTVDGETTEAHFDSYSKQARKEGGRKIVTYLLHPDKFDDYQEIHPAIGMIPNVSATSPGKPFGYGLAIEWRVPVMLRTKPANKSNPRGWFEGTGVAYGDTKMGKVRLYSGNKRQRDIWNRIIIIMPWDAPERGWKRLEP